MFRRRNAERAKMEPEMCVLLRCPARYPGDVLQGVAIVDFASPVDLLTLQVCLSGEERTSLGGLLLTDKNPEARRTLYYEQFVTLRGVDHDALQQRRDLLGRRHTVVSQDALLRKSTPSAPPPSNNTNSGTNGTGASLPDVPSKESSLCDLSPSIINAAAGAGGTVHLVPGTYSFPFKVTLPDSLPPSRELLRPREGTSVLRYRAVATMILGGGKVYTVETPFRVNTLPVQIQRWFELHNDEQNGSDASVRDEAEMGAPGLEGGAARLGLKSRLMSSPGTTSADAADREHEVACQRRIRHYRQFPEQKLMAERAEYEKRAEAREGKKEEKGDGSPSPQTVHDLVDSGRQNNRKARPKTYRERRARQEAADSRSVDDNEGNGTAEEEERGEEEEMGDEVRAFALDEEESEATSSPEAAKPLLSRAAGHSLAANAGADATNITKERKKKHRHHRKGSDAANGVNGSAMLESNVDQLDFTPPGETLVPISAHMAVRQSVDTGATSPGDAAAASHKKSSRRKGGQDERGEEDEKKSQGTQAHRRRPRFVPPPWNQEFDISLRGGFLRTGKVKVKMSLRSPLISVGHGRVMVKLLVDNSEGGGNITKVKYSLITRCYIRTKTEVYNYHVDSAELITDVNIEKGTIVAIPEEEVLVPESTPLTLLTEGMGTMTFLNVRFYVGTAFKTFSKSVETEVVLVSGQDSQNNSRRLLCWTCFYRRRNNQVARELTVHPPTVNLSEQNAKMRVMPAAELDNPTVSFGNSNNGTDASSMAPSAMSRSLVIMRKSRRVSKDAPSLDARRLASALNYDEVIFVPPVNDDDFAGPSGHVDPMAMLNPFAMPSTNVGSTLPSAEKDDYEQQ